MLNGRCRIHGGLSTGARTEDGKQRIRRAVTTHGLRTKESLRQRGMVRRLLSEWAHLQKLLQ
ncbi:HGGxSTG domain-containing protein [Bryobacter aggregatus]|uniref:HGGxSTG domain-containing protein n=1 Tax=Bryobacter aggregatus TaxID=360054 RepID=UPI003B50F5F6